MQLYECKSFDNFARLCSCFSAYVLLTVHILRIAACMTFKEISHFRAMKIPYYAFSISVPRISGYPSRPLQNDSANENITILKKKDNIIVGSGSK